MGGGGNGGMGWGHAPVWCAHKPIVVCTKQIVVCTTHQARNTKPRDLKPQKEMQMNVFKRTK